MNQSKSSPVYTVNLRQETPMIHFQSGETGAGPRASEMKPKLDRFLLERYKENELEGCFIEKEKHPALNYKMQIIANVKSPEMKEPNSKLFLGNIGTKNGKDKIKTVYYNKPIQLRIICFNKKLMRMIQESLPIFFLVHNFGMRQSKGFGSFCIDSIHAKKALELISTDCLNSNVSTYAIQYPIKNIDAIFRDIFIIYSLLKNGINNPGCVGEQGYFKSYLTRYFLKKQIAGEKRYLKASEIAPKVKRSTTTKKFDEEKIQEYRYIRGLLGATERVEYINRLGQDDRPDRQEGKTKILFSGKQVDRIPSPILFTVVDSTLFIIVKKIQEKAYGQEFSFSIQNDRRLNEQEHHLITPTKEEFDLDDIMRGFVRELNSPQFRDRLKKYSPKVRGITFVDQNIRIQTLGGSQSK